MLGALAPAGGVALILRLSHPARWATLTRSAVTARDADAAARRVDGSPEPHCQHEVNWTGNALMAGVMTSVVVTLAWSALS